MAKGKGGIGMKSLAFIMASLGLFGSAGGSNYLPQNNAKSVRAKDAVNNLPNTGAPSKENKKGFSEDNPYKYKKKGFMNQRKYRRHCRSNPHLFRSKKHRSKN